MSTIKSSAENLTLNADGSGNDIIIQSNAATKAIVTAEGNVGVGTNTPLMASTAYNGLHVNATYPTVKLSANATGHAATDGFHLRIDSTPRVEYWNYENSDQVFANNNGVKLRLLAGGGLCFGTDTAAANALDDYEEGAYTATVTTGGGTITLDSSVNTLAYTKIGRVVHINGRIKVSAVSSPTGDFSINLPFTSSSAIAGQGDFASLHGYTHNVNLDSTCLSTFFEIATGSAVAGLISVKDAAAWDTQTADWFTANGSEYVYVHGTYIV